jgi:multicomponent Na+:H+ antiporter subunit D
MNALLTLPILIPLATGALCLVIGRRPLWHRRISAIGAAAHFLSALALLAAAHRHGIVVSPVGGWPPPFGITLVADIFGAIMVVLTGLMGLSVFVYSLGAMDEERERYGYYPLLNVLLMGVSGSFLTGDIFNLYVWFEVMLISSFALLALGGERPQLEGAIKYVALNLIASALFLSGIGILYGLTGALNMAALAERLRGMPENGAVIAVAMLFLVAFGVKAAVFPLFFWLPASYHTCPVAVSAIFAGLLTKVGVYALIRVFTLLFIQDPGYTHSLLLVIAVLTMVSGVFGAVSQNEFRRILSFHIISQIGYMILGLAIYTPLALAGSIFYIAHHIVVKTNLFLVSGVARRLGGSYELKKLGGLYAAYPGVAVLFLIPALSLAGLPPLSGFVAKLALVRAGLEAEAWVAVGAALAVSLFTLMSMMKIWNEAFWKNAPEGEPEGRPVRTMLAPIVALAGVTLWIGLISGPLLDLSARAAGQLLDPTAYVRAVLEAQP